ncbi:MAG: hypothetical protein AABZ12_02160 [Planctomycetota bacterium]
MNCQASRRRSTRCVQAAWLTVAAAMSGTAVGPHRAGANEPPPFVQPASREEIAALIADLSDRSYARRTEATRRLLAAGMEAYDDLKLVAAGSDLEASIRAKRLVAALDSLFFVGTEVSIEFSRNEIAWNESVDLLLTLRNNSDRPARIPFEVEPTATDEPQIAQAAQVGRMLDATEWLTVTAPGGSTLTLSVDDIGADEEVVKVVQSRLNSGPASVIPPRQELRLVVRDFNRGWARIPLLDAGLYSVAFTYQPGWNDESLTAGGIGRVASNAASVRVTQAAPPTVSRHGVEADLEVLREGREVIARLTNRSDLPVFVNLNFGPGLPFAEGRWVYEKAERRLEIPHESKSGVSWRDFRTALLKEVPAGESVEVVRTGWEDLRNRWGAAGAKLDADPWRLSFSYASYLDRKWQQRQGEALTADDVPLVLRDRLPRRLLVTRQVSAGVDVQLDQIAP